MGFRLVGGAYAPIPQSVEGGIHSDVLGLDFHIRERRLAVYDPVVRQWLQTPAEAAEARGTRIHRTTESRRRSRTAQRTTHTFTSTHLKDFRGNTNPFGKYGET